MKTPPSRKPRQILPPEPLWKPVLPHTTTATTTVATPQPPPVVLEDRGTVRHVLTRKALRPVLAPDLLRHATREALGAVGARAPVEQEHLRGQMQDRLGGDGRGEDRPFACCVQGSALGRTHGLTDGLARGHRSATHKLAIAAEA